MIMSTFIEWSEHNELTLGNVSILSRFLIFVLDSVNSMPSTIDHSYLRQADRISSSLYDQHATSNTFYQNSAVSWTSRLSSNHQNWTIMIN